MGDIAELKNAHAKMKTGSLYKSWAQSNPGEASKFDSYVNSVVAGSNPTAPLLATATGQGLVGYVDSGFKVVAPPASNKYNGIGIWDVADASVSPPVPVAHSEIANAVQQGVWWWADPNYDQYTFPNAAIKATYKNGVEIKDDTAAATPSYSASCVPFKAAKPEWIAKKNGALLEAYSSKSDALNYVALLGNVEYQNQCALNIVNTLKEYGLKEIYIDNCYGNVTPVSKGGVLPDGFTSDAQWRDTQVIPWVINTLSQVVRAGYYVFILIGDGPQGTEYYDGGDSWIRFLNQLTAAEVANNVTAFHGVLAEFWMNGQNNAPRPDKTGAWYWNGAGWQRLVKVVEDAGKDFHPLTYSDGKTSERYGKGCFWLDAQGQSGNRKSTYWTWSLNDPFIQLDLSNPSGPRTKEGNIHVRPYPNNKKLYVNMLDTVQTTPSGVTVGATDAVFQ